MHARVNVPCVDPTIYQVFELGSFGGTYFRPINSGEQIRNKSQCVRHIIFICLVVI